MNSQGIRAIQLEIVVLHGDVPAPADADAAMAVNERVVPNRPPAHNAASQKVNIVWVGNFKPLAVDTGSRIGIQIR